MIKKTLCFIIAFLSVFSFCLPCFAGTSLSVSPAVSEYYYINDCADFLSDAEESEIVSLLAEANSKFDFGIYILTEEYADNKGENYYISKARKYIGQMTTDGILLYVVEDHAETNYIRVEYVYSSTRMMNEEATDYLYESIRGDVRNHDYLSAFKLYIKEASSIIEDFSQQKEFKAPFEWLKYILIGLGVGLVVALTVTLIMKSKLKSVRSNNYASEYTVPGSLNIRNASELYLYSTVTKTPKPKVSSTSGGGSGGSGGRA